MSEIKFFMGQMVRFADFVAENFEGSCFDPYGTFRVIDVTDVPDKCTCGRPWDNPGHSSGCSLGHASYRSRVGHSQVVRLVDQSGREFPLQVTGTFLEPA